MTSRPSQLGLRAFPPRSDLKSAGGRRRLWLASEPVASVLTLAGRVSVFGRPATAQLRQYSIQPLSARPEASIRALAGLTEHQLAISPLGAP